MTDPVFVSPDAARVAPGGVVALSGTEAKHVAVQRLAAGERIDVVDGHGRRAVGVIEDAGLDVVTVRVESVSTDEDPELVLVQALAKGGRDEDAIEAATQLGATRVIPWAAERSIVKWSGPKEDKARASWRDRVTAAAKQSRRARIPEVDALVTTANLAGLVAEATRRGALVLVLHESATAPLALPSRPGEPLEPLWVLVGPEGGIADGELAALTAAGGVATRLGPYVLRSSQAGPAAIAAAAALRGAWAAPSSAL